MDLILRAAWRLLRAVRAVELTLGVGLLAAIVVMITVQVFTRYVFNRPIVWVEDVATFAFIWCVFLGAAVGLKDLRHIRIETFLARLDPRFAAVLHALLYLVILACCVLVARLAWDVMDTEARSLTISLPINVPRHWFYSVPLFCALVSMAATALYFVAAHLHHAMTGRAIEAEADAALRAAHERALDEAEVRVAEGSL
jgi:TRAP-type C4-dicarboxylate transport system permease small subunit